MARFDNACMWLSWVLPRRVVYWCGIRIVAAATTGQYSGTVVPELGWHEALKRWDAAAK